MIIQMRLAALRGGPCVSGGRFRAHFRRGSTRRQAQAHRRARPSPSCAAAGRRACVPQHGRAGAFRVDMIVQGGHRPGGHEMSAVKSLGSILVATPVGWAAMAVAVIALVRLSAA